MEKEVLREKDKPKDKYLLIFWEENYQLDNVL
jgi:hypothetical protein